MISQHKLSLNHSFLLDTLVATDNLLIIQDLDGVCMSLVKDPLSRTIDPTYVQATHALDGHFYVLTNGEHVGKRGINSIIERAVGEQENVREEGAYLPGLAAGGVQWQNRYGHLDYPGVSEAEMTFLEAVPQRIRHALEDFFEQHPVIDPAQLENLIAASVLDNEASPTANLNTLYEAMEEHPAIFRTLQREMEQLMHTLLQEAHQQHLEDSFFVHYAPNLGRDDQGDEIVWFAGDGESGTTDFQFMLRGAIKEAGVLALLNRYYHQRTGEYPLGETFNAREAPKDIPALVDLVVKNFDPDPFPLLVGVGDTVTSQGEEVDGQLIFRRGGSDRNFLTLIQEIGRALAKPYAVIYIDSSGGELKNRKALKVEQQNGEWVVTEGIGDRRDQSDPLEINFVFPGGHKQYIEFFRKLAAAKATA